MISRFIVFFSFLLVFSSCKEEPPQIQSTAPNTFESNYFEDYESPRFKWGYINTKAELIIEALYDDCREFSEGLALANFEGRWGFIDTNGTNVIAHQYPEAQAFSDGRAIVKTFEGQTQVIDKSGAIVFQLEHDEIKKFTDGIAFVRAENRWGTIQKNGEAGISMKYEKLKRLSAEAIIAKLNGKYGILDYQENVLIPFQFDKISFEDEFPLVAKSDNVCSLITDNFKIIPTRYSQILAFSKNKSIAKQKGYVLIDAQGLKIKDLSYEKVQYGGEGFWKYKQDNKWGILDPEGNEITAAKYPLMNRYEEGFLTFGLNDESWGYLDTKGEEFIKAQFPLVWDFENGFSRFITRSGVGFIDRTGEVVIEPQFYEVRDFQEGLARVQIFR